MSWTVLPGEYCPSLSEIPSIGDVVYHELTSHSPEQHDNLVSYQRSKVSIDRHPLSRLLSDLSAQQSFERHWILSPNHHFCRRTWDRIRHRICYRISTPTVIPRIDGILISLYRLGHRSILLCSATSTRSTASRRCLYAPSWSLVSRTVRDTCNRHTDRSQPDLERYEEYPSPEAMLLVSVCLLYAPRE